MTSTERVRHRGCSSLPFHVYQLTWHTGRNTGGSNCLHPLFDDERGVIYWLQDGKVRVGGLLGQALMSRQTPKVEGGCVRARLRATAM